MREYIINVTWADIEEGVPGDIAACPVAMAMERAGLAGVYVPRDDLPEVARNFLARFDRGSYVTPIRFSLWLPGPAAAEPLPVYAGDRPARFDPVAAAAPRRVDVNGRPARFDPRPTLVYRGRYW